MAMVSQPQATLDDLYRHDGKAELIGGKLVQIMPTGRRPNRVAFQIARSLDDYSRATGVGEAYTDNMGFTVPVLPSGRQSFSPDASYFAGPFVDDPMRFIDAPPTFAVEVRSENDYTPTAEIALAEKRADYFQAGTLAVWDVDPVNEIIMLYTAAAPTQPTVFRRGDLAHAGTAVPGWQVGVDVIFA